MNKITLMGRLTAQPELKYSNTGTAYANFTVAVNRFKDRDKADFFRCVCFGKTAEMMASKLDKGCRVMVEGEVNIDNVEKDGQKLTYINVPVQRVEVIDWANNANAPAKPQKENETEYGFDDVPF